jgi:hypothetical protein
MKAGRVVALVIGAVLALVGAVLLITGGVLTAVTLVVRDGEGFFSTGTGSLTSGTYAITSEEIDLGAEPGPGDWSPSGWATVRIEAEAVGEGDEVFIGIARASDVAAYLDGVLHAEVDDVRVDPFRLDYDVRPGGPPASPPGDEDFWVASASGSGEQTLRWEVESGSWAVVLMNADASRGVEVEASIALRIPALIWVGIGMLIAAVVLLIAGVVLIVVGASGAGAAAEPGAMPPPTVAAAHPVQVTGRLDEPLSRWLWLVKWILVVPHAIVLVFLWIAFVVTTVIAAFAILFTRRYPSNLFRFNSGVLRWTWRVAFYANSAFATDRYPPFTLARTDYPADLEIAEPAQLNRWLWLVKWLLAIPHLIILGIIGGGLWLGEGGDDRWVGIGLLGILVLVAGVTLLFRGRYPTGVFAFVMGLNRWVLRVVAYLALMTDRYPPFRLDQGGEEPPQATGGEEPLP